MAMCPRGLGAFNRLVAEDFLLVPGRRKEEARRVLISASKDQYGFEAPNRFLVLFCDQKRIPRDIRAPQKIDSSQYPGTE
jgi:hypothetical protein